MCEEERITSESPFYKVLEYWADEVIRTERSLPEGLSNPVSDQEMTLKNGMQVKILIGRNVHDQD